jgi:hypothetical protein
VPDPPFTSAGCCAAGNSPGSVRGSIANGCGAALAPVHGHGLCLVLLLHDVLGVDSRPARGCAVVGAVSWRLSLRYSGVHCRKVPVLVALHSPRRALPAKCSCLVPVLCNSRRVWRYPVSSCLRCVEHKCDVVILTPSLLLTLPLSYRRSSPRCFSHPPASVVAVEVVLLLLLPKWLVVATAACHAVGCRRRKASGAWLLPTLLLGQSAGVPVAHHGVGGCHCCSSSCSPLLAPPRLEAWVDLRLRHVACCEPLRSRTVGRRRRCPWRGT